MIKYEIDRSSLKIAILEPLDKAMRKAALRAANRTISSCRTRVKRDISEKLGIKQKDINARLYMELAGATRGVASLYLLGTRIPLYQFGARRKTVRTAKGKRVGVTALVHGQRQLIPGAFIATMPSGKEGVFARKGDERLPIRQLFSTEATELLKMDGGYMTQLSAFARETFEKNFSNDFKYFHGQGA